MVMFMVPRMTVRVSSCRARLHSRRVVWRSGLLRPWFWTVIVVVVVLSGTIMAVVASRLGACYAVVLAGEDFVVFTPCGVFVMSLA